MSEAARRITASAPGGIGNIGPALDVLGCAVAGARDEVTVAEVAGQVDVPDQDVAPFAVLADHAAQHGLALRSAARQHRRVLRRVQRGPDVVAHAAVDRDVGPLQTALEIDDLDGADGVNRHRGGAADRTSGLDGVAGLGEPVRPTLVLDDLAQARGELIRRRRCVVRGVGDAEATAEVELGQIDAGRLPELRDEAHRAARGDLERPGVEDLAPDV